MHRKTPDRLAWLLVFALGIGACESRQHLVEQHLLEFGTIITITLVSDDLSQAQQILTQVEQNLKQYRRQWHAWEESDLTRFNTALQQGEPIRVPASLSQMLRLSREYFDATGGLFNPALGELIAAQGFHASEADRDRIDAIKQDIPGMHDLEFDGQLVVSRNPRLQLDLGGIAKGYAIGLIGDYLERNGIENYLVNAGGDLLTSGNRLGRPWRIGIQNPFAPGVIASLKLDGKHSLFTSGNYQRAYWRGEQLAHHIIDPRSGESSQGQSSATVLTRDPVRADVAATALMIDGIDGHRWLASSLQIADYLVVSDDREIILSQSLADKIDVSVAWSTRIVK